MQIIVIGCGKVGARFANTLSKEGHDIAIIDNDSNVFKALNPGFDGITIVGVPIDQDVLKEAGIETADVLAAVTPDDNVNIMVCQVAKEIFKVPKVIARIFDPAREQMFHQFGLQTVCPTKMSVEVIRSMIMKGNDTPLHTIGNTVLNYDYMKAQNIYYGKSLSTVKAKENSLVFGMIKNGCFYLANEDVIVSQGDIIVMVRKGE